MLNRSLAPEIHPIRPFDFVKPETITLPNGLECHTVNAGIQPIVSLQLVFPTANHLSISEVRAHFASRMLLEGTSKRSNEEISELLASYGAFLDSDSGFDFANLELYCLTKQLPELAELICEILTDSTFPEAGFEHIRKVTFEQQKINFEKSQVVASLKFREKLFGTENPYGKHKTLENIQNITRKEAQEYYETVYKNRPFGLIMAGKFTDNDLKIIKDTFGKLELSTPKIPTANYKIPKVTEKNTYEEKENAFQTSVRIGRELFVRTHPDYLKMSVLNTVFGGYFGSRLMSNIREDKGYTYGIYSSIVPMKNAGYLIIGGDVQKEFRKETIREILKEMQRLRTEPIPEEELEIVKNYICGKFVKSLKTPLEVAGKYRSVYFYGLSPDYFSAYISQINAVTSDQLLELAQQYFQEEECLQVLVG